jgi:uncharacterized membrane protein
VSERASGEFRPVVWADDDPTELPRRADAADAYVTDVADGGPKVGNDNGESSSSYAFHAVTWTDDGVTDLGTSLDDDSGYSTASGVNSRGTVVGASEVAPAYEGSLRPVRWVDEEIEELGRLSDDDQAGGRAADVDSRGTVVGASDRDDGPARAVRWEPR